MWWDQIKYVSDSRYLEGLGEALDDAERPDALRGICETFPSIPESFHV